MCRQSEAATLRHVGRVVVWSCLIGRTGNISLSHHILASCLRRFLSEVTQKWVAVMIRAGRTLQTLRKATSLLQQLNTQDETDRTGGILGKSPWTNWFWTACGENEDPPSTVDLRGDEEGGEVMVIFLTRGKSSPPASFQIITLHFLLKVWRWVASSMLLSNC